LSLIIAKSAAKERIELPNLSGRGRMRVNTKAKIFLVLKVLITQFEKKTASKMFFLLLFAFYS